MTAPDVTVAGLLAAQDSLDLLRRWKLRPATITVGGVNSAIGKFDGEGFEGELTIDVPLISLIGSVAAGDRVMVMTVPPSGNYIISTRDPRANVIAWHERTTPSTPSASAQEVVRIDDIPIRAGHRYTVDTSNFIMFSSIAATSAGSARVSYELGGDQAATVSPLLTVYNTSLIPTTGDGVGAKISVDLPVQLSDTVLSILLYTTRTVGGGLISIFADPVVPLQFRVIDSGPAVEDTGDDL